MKKISILIAVVAFFLVACQNSSTEVVTDKDPAPVVQATPKPTAPPPPTEILPELRPQDLKPEEMGLYSRLANLFPYDKETISDEDSVNIMNVAKYIYLIDMVEKPRMRSFKPKPGEQLQEVRRNGKIVKVIYTMDNEEVSKQQRFYLRNDKIVYFADRLWQKTTVPPYATETYAFYEDGNPLKILQRKANLEVGAKPRALIKMPVQSGDHNVDKVNAELQAKWLEVKDYLDGNL